MRRLSRLIHSPHHLFTFEVCGRLLSFTRAAEELGVSQPAISLAIRQLEDALGVKLFHREHRSVRLTAAGQALYIECSNGLQRIYAVASKLNDDSQRNHVTLSVTTAFASQWVVPKLGSLHADHPGIDLRLQVVDRDVDFNDPESSLSIRNNVGRPKGYKSYLIAREKLIPVASPAYLSRYGKPNSIAELAKHSLIHLEEPYRKRATWADWFGAKSAGISPPNGGTKLNDYALVVQAAIAGEGIAMGWHHIVSDLIEKQILAIALDQSWSSNNDTWLIWSKNVELNPQTVKIRDWIVRSA
ncbi:MAG: DNA-binding transcriptional LysR family regulator [Pseudoalteromonas tetraodonis]|jgi:DNA-binding transcriptional LysR family regulator